MWCMVICLKARPGLKPNAPAKLADETLFGASLGGVRRSRFFKLGLEESEVCVSCKKTSEQKRSTGLH